MSSPLKLQLKTIYGYLDCRTLFQLAEIVNPCYISGQFQNIKGGYVEVDHDLNPKDPFPFEGGLEKVVVTLTD
jgi:hypothetical protein